MGDSEVPDEDSAGADRRVARAGVVAIGEAVIQAARPGKHGHAPALGKADSVFNLDMGVVWGKIVATHVSA